MEFYDTIDGVSKAFRRTNINEDVVRFWDDMDEEELDYWKGYFEDGFTTMFSVVIEI